MVCALNREKQELNPLREKNSFYSIPFHGLPIIEKHKITWTTIQTTGHL